MELSYSLTVDDAIALGLHNATRTAEGRRELMKMRLVLPAFFALIAIVQTWSFPQWLMCVMGSGIWLLVFPWVWRTRVRRSTRRIYKNIQNQHMIGSQRLTLSPEGLHCLRDDGRFTSLWDAIEIAETDNNAFLYTTTLTAYVVPKHAFGDAEQFRAFVTEARQLQAAARRVPAPRASDLPPVASAM